MSDSFTDFDLGPSLQHAISALKWTAPREIQSQTIPAVLKGRDVLGLAQTGTGKTAAFALPILEGILSRKGKGIRALVLAPTRELAIQIEREFRALARFTGVKTLSIFGGVSMVHQIRELRNRPSIIVACPGRLIDMLNRGAINLRGLDTLVLDEVDRLMDMGFLPDIRKIIEALPGERQNLLWSATMPPEIRKLADDILNDPHSVDLAPPTPIETISHALYPVERKGKLKLLEHLMKTDSIRSAIIFTRTKHRARKLADQLVKKGRRAVALQGNMSQNQRDRAMNGFRKGRFDILVATDIAARGIDVAQVSHVLNFDIPDTPDAYTHRIGRTGRAERSGKAYTFVTGEDASMVREIERKIGSRIPRMRVEGIDAPASTAPETPRIPAGKPARPVRSRRPSGNGTPPSRNRQKEQDRSGREKGSSHRTEKDRKPFWKRTGSATSDSRPRKRGKVREGAKQTGGKARIRTPRKTATSASRGNRNRISS